MPVLVVQNALTNNSNFDDCGLTDDDFGDLGACLDLIGRTSINVM